MSAQETIEAMTKKLVSELKPEQVILFGSYAWGQPTKDSDVDLCLVYNDLKENARDMSIKAMGLISGFGYSKDILVKTKTQLEYYRPALASLERQFLMSGKNLTGCQ